VHSNGLTLARRALLDDGALSIDATPAELGGASIADTLLEPTVIYVRAVLELLRSEIPVHGLAHITGGGVLNLLRIGSAGYEISAPLPVPPIFELIAELGSVPTAEMWEVFNMGCGFCAIVPDGRADEAVALLTKHHPGTAVIGRLTPKAGEIRLPGLALAGDSSGLRQS
jgi:phosphoribosylformylglycinamidine cyclo-ligase